MKIYQHYYDFGVLFLILASPIYANFDPNHDEYGSSSKVYDPFVDDVSFQDVFYLVQPQMDDNLPFEPDFFNTEISLDISDHRLYDIDKLFHHDDSTINSNEPPFAVIYPNHPQELTLIDLDFATDFEPEDIPTVEINELTFVDPIDEPCDPPSLHPASVRITNLDNFYNDPSMSAIVNSDPDPDLSIDVDVTVINNPDFDNEMTVIDSSIDEPFDSSPHLSSAVRIAKLNDFYNDPFISAMFDSDPNPDVNVIDNPDSSDYSDHFDSSEDSKRGGFFKNMRSKFTSPPKSKMPIDENSYDSFDPVCADEDEPVSDPIIEDYLNSPNDLVAQIEAIKEEKFVALEEGVEAKKSMMSRLFDLVPHSGHVIDDIIGHHHHDKKPCNIDHFMEVVLYDLDLIHDLYSELETLKPVCEIYAVDVPEEEDATVYVESHFDPSYYGPHYIEQTRNSVQFHSNHLPSEQYDDSSEYHPISSTAEYFHNHYDDYLEPDFKHDFLHFMPRLVHSGHNVFTNIEENIIQAKDAMISLMPDFRHMRYRQTEPAEPEYIPDEINSFYDSEPDVYEELWIRQHHPEYNTVVDTAVVVEPNLEVVVKEEVVVDPYASYSRYQDTFDEKVTHNLYHPHKKPYYEDSKTQPPYYPHSQNIYNKPVESTYVSNSYYVEQYPKPTYVNKPLLNQPYPYLSSNQIIYGLPIQPNTQYPSPKVKPYQGFRY